VRSVSETLPQKESMTLRAVTHAVVSLVEKGAAHVIMSISAREQLNDLPDDVLIKATLFYYSDPRDALIKGLGE